MSDSRARSNQVPSIEEVDGALKGVRARLRGHGGDLEIVDVNEDGEVTVEFKGACRGCPAVGFTYGAVVETELMAIEGVESVRAEQVRMAPAVRRRIRAMAQGTA